MLTPKAGIDAASVSNETEGSISGEEGAGRSRTTVSRAANVEPSEQNCAESVVLPEAVAREASAEEVLEASLNYSRSLLVNDEDDQRGGLYPSLEQLEFDHALAVSLQEEEERKVRASRKQRMEEGSHQHSQIPVAAASRTTIAAMPSSSVTSVAARPASSAAASQRTAVAAAAAIPNSPAVAVETMPAPSTATIAAMPAVAAAPAAFAEAYDEDDPVMRKIRQEEEIMRRSTNSEEVVAEATLEPMDHEGAIPTAATATFEASATATLESSYTEEEMGFARAFADGTPSEIFATATLEDEPMMMMSSMTVYGSSTDVVPEATLETDDMRATDVVAEATLESVQSTGIVAAEATVEEEMEMKPAAVPTHQPNQAYASIPDEEASVVAITEEFVHPSDLSNDDARAEFIGQDYSNSYNLEVTAAAPAAEAETLNQDEEVYDSQEATVLDSKPAATVSGWTNESSEARVLETGTESQTWTQEENIVIEEIAVTGRDEAEATVVDISEDYHPSEAQEEDDGVQATLIGSSATVLESGTDEQWAQQSVTIADLPTGEEQEATVLSVADGGPQQGGHNGVRAVFIGSDYTRSTSYPLTTPERPTRVQGERATSDPRGIYHSKESREIPSATPTTTNTDAVVPTPAAATWLPDTPTTEQQQEQQHQHQHKEQEQQQQHSTPVVTIQTPPPSRPPPPREEPPLLQAEVLNDGTPSVPAQSTSRREQSRTSSTGSRASQNSVQDGESSSRPNQICRSTSSVSSAERRGMLFSNVANAATSAARGTSTVMERLFGDNKQIKRRDFDMDTAVGSIVPRILLPWSVFPSETTGMWVATVNTNQKALDSNNIEEASKALRAFSVTTKEQAESLARAWAPPRMQPFSDNPLCSICGSRFAVFKRPCHCRNCGVCICNSCAVQWPSKMIPDTYNIKNESMVNICKSCDWLCSAFRLALLEGDHDQAIAIHSTGNVNLVTPFANVKGELFYPVHCAVLGKNLALLKWLVDEHCCPLRSIRVSGKTRDSSGSFTPILTSRGRSLLGIAMEQENVDTIRYLVVEKGMPLAGEKEMNVMRLVRVLDKVLRILPQTVVSIPDDFEESSTTVGVITSVNGVAASSPGSQQPSTPPPPQSASPTQSQNQHATEPSRQESWRTEASSDANERSTRNDDDENSIDDACIICFANSIDCVVTPCGHQICCMQCSTNIARCPVCSVDCSFIRVYKP